jgi:glycosyltransferase involved in cell wall biosynthesis
MRLLLLNYEFPPLGGGASAATLHMARELAARGHQVDVLTSSVRGHAAEELIDGVRVHRVLSLRRGVHDAGLVGAATYLVSATWKLRKLTRAGSFDCAHFFFALPTGALAPLWVRWTKQSYVVALRGSDVPGYDGGALLAALHRALRPLTRRILSGARQVTANSESLRDLAQGSFPGIPIEVITNGVCTTTFRPRRRPETESRRLLSVARLVSRKGLEDLIKALSDARLAESTLTIVGDGPLRSKLKVLARSRGVAHRVVFAGRLHGHELSECYEKADCFVLPSHAESCSMSLLEAMASGLPVVAARTGGIPELIEDGTNGKLFEAGDVSDLAAALAWMFASDERRRRIGAANRERAIARFGWPAIVSSYEQRCYGSESPGPRATVGGAHAALQAPCDQLTP